MFRNLNFTDKHYVFFIVLLVLLFFNGLFLHPELSYASRDSLDVYAFEYQHRYKTFQEYNELAFWNPYSYGGFPFFVGVSGYYPFNLIFLASGSFQLFNFYQVFHVLLAGLLMYGFARLIKLNPFPSFATAIAFMFGGNLLAKVGGAYPQLASYALMPLMFILLELLLRKKQFLFSVLFGSGLALLFFAGHQQYFYMIILALLVYFVLNIKNPGLIKAIFYFGFSFFLAISLSAVYLLPILEMGENLSRFDEGLKGANYDYISSGSLPLRQLTNFFMPNLYGNGWKPLDNGLTTYWGAPVYNELYVYMGLVTLFLVFFALKDLKNIWKFGILAVFALIYALGASTPLFDLILLIPGADLFRTPGRMLMVVSFCFAVMAGHGMEYLLRKDRPFGKPFFFISILTVFLSIILTASMLVFKAPILNLGEQVLNQLYYDIYADSIFVQTHSFESLLNLSNLAYSEAFSALAYFTIFLSVLVVVFLLLKNFKDLLKLFIITALIFDLFLVNMQFVEGSDLNEFLKETEIIGFLKDRKESGSLFRVFASEQSLFRQFFAQKYGIHKLLGAGSSRIAFFDKFLDKGLGIVDETHARIKWGELIVPAERLESGYIAKLLGMWNVKYILSKDKLSNPAFEPVLGTVDGIVYANKKVLPRAYVVRNAEVLSQEDIFAGMQSDSFDPQETILLEQVVQHPLTNSGEFKEAEIVKYTPNEITVKVYLYKPGYLVLADNYYPGWSAYDNCIKKPVLKANYAMRAVYLEEGPHIVKFKREPTYLWVGAIISISALIFVVLYLLVYGGLRWIKKSKLGY